VPLDQRQLAAALCLGGVEVAVSPYRGDGLQVPGQGQTAEWLLDLEDHGDCDLVHLNGYDHATLPFQSPRLVLGASCGVAWWRAVRGGDLPPVGDGYRHKVSSALAAADCVVVPSSWLLSCLEEQYGPLPPALVIPAGGSPDGLAPGEKEPFVLGVGGLADDEKNTALLARVAQTLPWPVKIAGAPGPKRGDPAGAVLLGRLPPHELAAVYAQAAIFVSTSRFETFAFDVHDAALAECALVLPDLPGLRELWSGAAVFVPPDDEEGLRSALCTLMNQPELTALLALRAHQRAASFSATRMTKRYLAAYRQLLTVHARHHPHELRSSCVS
jgi:glycogen synthase